jgi:hypothetical protein
MAFSPYVKVGLTHLFTGKTPDVTATLQGAPAGTTPFFLRTNNEKNSADCIVMPNFNAKYICAKRIRVPFLSVDQFAFVARSSEGSMSVGVFST